MPGFVSKSNQILSTIASYGAIVFCVVLGISGLLGVILLITICHFYYQERQKEISNIISLYAYLILSKR